MTARASQSGRDGCAWRRKDRYTARNGTNLSKHQIVRQSASSGSCLRYPLLWLAVSALLANTALAAGPAPAPADAKTAAKGKPAAPKKQPDRVTLNFQDANIEALIAAVSQITGKSFIVDPKVKGKVTLISGDKMSAEQVYQVFLSVLEVNNFSAVESGGVVRVVPSSQAKQSPIPTSLTTPGFLGDTQVTQVYQLKHGSVQDLVPVVRPLLPPTSHFAAHAASNTLVFTDTAINTERILGIVQRLDQPPIKGTSEVIRLRYAKSSDLVKIIDKLLTTEQKSADPQAKTQPVSVQADEATNSLVVHAPQDQMRAVRATIQKLDVRRAQVFVEVLIAEVSTDKAAELGITWQALDPNPGKAETTASTSFRESKGGLTLGFLNKYVTDLAGNIVPDLRIVLRALRSDNNTNILSTPNLLTLDNESAEIVVGQEVPFVTGQFVTSASSTTTTTGSTGTDGTTTGTTTTPTVNPFQTIQRKNVGLTLKVTPHISEGDAIRMEIAQEVSSVSPTQVQGAADLITNTRSIKATVIADDGQIIVLGGLITDDFKDTVEWVPFLGKIPVIGALFRTKSKTAVKTNLMVFMRPKVIRSTADIAETTESKYGGIRRQQEFGQPDTKRLIHGATPPVLPELKRASPKLAPAAPADVGKAPEPGTGAAPAANGVPEKAETRTDPLPGTP